MPRPKLTSEVVLLIGSFVIAIAVWLVAKQNDFENQILGVQLTAEGAPENIEVQIDPPMVNVSIQYPKTFAHLIRAEAFSIELKGINENLAGALDYNYTPFNITLRNVATKNLPETVRPTALAQDYVTLGARLYTQKAIISVIQKGKPKEGYRLIENPPRVEPKEVLITGSPKVIEEALAPQKDYIILETEPVDIEGKKDSFFTPVKAILPKGLKYVKHDTSRVQTLDELEVQVHIVIVEEERKKTITNVPIVIKAFSENLIPEYSPTQASVTVEAPLSMLSELTKESFLFIPRQPLEERAGYTADIAIDAKFTDNIPPRIREKATIISYQPEVIHIEIKSRAQEQETPPEPEEQPEIIIPTQTPVFIGPAIPPELMPTPETE